MTEPACKDCRFSNPSHTNPSGKQFDECRYNPPTMSSTATDESYGFGWPLVNVNDWCGKFESKTKPKMKPDPTYYKVPISEWPEDVRLGRVTHTEAMEIMRRQSEREGVYRDTVPWRAVGLPSNLRDAIERNAELIDHKMDEHGHIMAESVVPLGYTDIVEQLGKDMARIEMVTTHGTPIRRPDYNVWEYFYGELWEFLINPENMSWSWLVVCTAFATPTVISWRNKRWHNDGVYGKDYPPLERESR